MTASPRPNAIERLGAAGHRQLNPRAVYDRLLDHDALTRDELAELTGLTRIAASASVDALVDRGLAMQVPAGARTAATARRPTRYDNATGSARTSLAAPRRPAVGRGGPAAKQFALTPSAGYVVAADIRHASVTIAAADLTGRIAARLRLPFDDPDDAAGMLTDAISRCLLAADADVARLRRVVLGSPGVIDPRTGEFAFAYLLPTWKRTVTADLRRRLGRPVVFENDVNLAAMAEARFGHGRGVPHLVFAWFGEGLGLGLVLNGRLYRGRNGWAGEVGYLNAPVLAMPPEVAGMPGSVHQLASTLGVTALAQLHGFPTDPAEAVTAALSAGKAGDAFLDEVARRVAIVVSTASLLVDPSVLVIDGSYLAAGGDELLARIRYEAQRLSPIPVPIELSAVHDDPILRGALQTALDDARDSLFTA